MTDALERRISRLETRVARLEKNKPAPVPAPAPAPAPTPAPAPAPAPTGLAPVGVNLEGVHDYSRLLPFVDLMKGSRPWGGVGTPWDEAAPTDALGWPTGDAAVVVHMVTKSAGELHSPYIVPGTYPLSFKGKAVVEPIASGGVSVTNYRHDTATNVSTADVVIPTGQTQLMLAFRQTAGGVRDVQLRRPGYTPADTFTSEFKAAVAPFSVLRFMDFTRTNDNPVRTWAERTTPAHATQGGVKGAAWEYAIQMANELGKDLWINVPANADEAYVRALATLLKNTLATDLTVYVEYSNELWNFIFSQATDNLNAAKLDPSLAVEPDASNVYWQAYRRVGKMAVRLSQLFSEVMGASARNTRFRVVLATQFAYRAVTEQTLKYIATHHGAPASFLYGVAGAPYYILTDQQANNSTLSVDGVLAGLQSALTAITPSFHAGRLYDGGDYREATQKALADFYGIKSLAYEGGNDLLQADVNLANKVAANYDLRAGSQTSEYLREWFKAGNDLFMYFSLSSQWGRYGYWGLTNDPANLNTAKYLAAKQVAETQLANLTP